jgi:sulfatase modifying factor 1
VTDTGIRKVEILTHLKIQNVLCVTVTTLLSLIPSVVLSENNIVPVVGKNLMFDQTEVTIGAFENFVRATGTVTQAERDGGGLVYAGGWEQKAGWTWLTPYGQAAHPDEPAVHVTFDEAAQYCKWAGKRLPTEEEWIIAAYNEQRPKPPQPFTRGQTYQYPTGDTPEGANCLGDCGDAPAINYSSKLSRGTGHARAGTTSAGVNGLYDMGGTVWEWVDIPDKLSKGTRGGSWWYGARQMKADYKATKPRDIAVVYIGFRCVNGSKVDVSAYKKVVSN